MVNRSCCLKLAVMVVVFFQELSVFEFIEAYPTSSKGMCGIVRINVNTCYILVIMSSNSI